MSFIEDEEAFGVFDQQANDGDAMPLEDVPLDTETGEIGDAMDQEYTAGLDQGRLA